MKGLGTSTRIAGLTTKRVEALADGVFAIAMTLLVLNLKVPHIAEVDTAVEVRALLSEQWHKFSNYMVSFMLLGIFWVNHHVQFHSIKRTDNSHVWINILTLMFVALIPFSTSLIGDYPELQITNVIFEANMLAVGLLFFWNWFYATRDHRLVDHDFDPKRIEIGIKKGLVTPVVSLMAMIVSFVSPRWSPLLYLSIPFILSRRTFRL